MQAPFSHFHCDIAYTISIVEFSSKPFRILRAVLLFPYPHTSLLTYFGSPITPISLLSGTIHHRSGFSPRPPRPTHLGTYVPLLCRYHWSRPWPLWEFHFHSFSSDAIIHFEYARTYMRTLCIRTDCVTWTDYKFLFEHLSSIIELMSITFESAQN